MERTWPSPTSTVAGSDTLTAAVYLPETAAPVISCVVPIWVPPLKNSTVPTPPDVITERRRGNGCRKRDIDRRGAGHRARRVGCDHRGRGVRLGRIYNCQGVVGPVPVTLMSTEL